MNIGQHLTLSNVDYFADRCSLLMLLTSLTEEQSLGLKAVHISAEAYLYTSELTGRSSNDNLTALAVDHILPSPAVFCKQRAPVHAVPAPHLVM